MQDVTHAQTRGRLLAGLMAMVLVFTMVVPTMVGAQSANASSTQLVNAPGTTSGWFINNGERQWVSTDCRTQLENAGLTFATTDWVDIAAVARADIEVSCDQIQATIQPSSGAASFVTNSAANQAGWVLTNGAKQWVSPQCRAQLSSAGAVFTIVAFSDIANLSQLTPAQSCDELANLISGDQSSLSGDATGSTCNNGAGVGALELTGDLQGCLIFFVETAVCTELNGFALLDETGTELFIGSWAGQTGEFTTEYTLKATFAQGACADLDAADYDAFYGKQLTGGCDHYITGSAGVFDGRNGLITFHDIIPDPGVSGASNFFYEGYLN